MHVISSASESAGSITTASLLDTRLVQNKQMKVQMLDEYKEEHGGAYDSPITTMHLGTSQKSLQPPSQFKLIKSSSMMSKKDKKYMDGHLIFNNIMMFVLDSHLKL